MYKSLIICGAIALSLALAGCAGSKPRPDSSGPLYYVTKGVTKVVFDRGGALYHGRIRAVADEIGRAHV